MLKNEVVTKLKNDIESNALSHAYILESPNQLFLEEATTDLLLAYFCETKTACRTCRQCLNVINNTNLQIINIGDATERIKKQEVLDLIAKLNITNLGEDDKKFYVIKNIEQLGPEASNAILKTLEEPPKGVTAFLLSNNRDEILPTIKSRCILFYIDDESFALENNILADVIQSGNKDELFLVGAKLRHLPKNEVVSILQDALKKVVLQEKVEIADKFYDAIYNIKKMTNTNLIIENLMIEIYEVL
jgi:DNA polymerase-3 subunit delta'